MRVMSLSGSRAPRWNRVGEPARVLRFKEEPDLYKGRPILVTKHREESGGDDWASQWRTKILPETFIPEYYI